MLTNKEDQLLLEIFSPWMGGADDDELYDAFKGLDPNDTDQLRAYIERDIQPNFSELSVNKIARAIELMERILEMPKLVQESIINILLFPFENPRDITTLYEITNEKLKEYLNQISTK